MRITNKQIERIVKAIEGAHDEDEKHSLIFEPNGPEGISVKMCIERVLCAQCGSAICSDADCGD